MKNLKINENWFKKTVSAVLILTTLTSFTGCSIKKADGKSETSKTLSTVVADNRMLSISDLRLKNLETEEIFVLDTIEGLVVGNKIDRNIDLVRIVFDSSVESILVGDEFIDVSNLGLFNSTLKNMFMIMYLKKKKSLKKKKKNLKKNIKKLLMKNFII